VFLALVTAGVGGIYFVAGHVDPRQRPPVRILDPGLVPDHSFPSGHVGTATAVYGAIVVLSWAYARRSRSWVWGLLVLPVLVLLARLYQGAHHLTDVLATVVYASVWVLVLARLLLTGVADRVSSGH
jgi:membrane-associated phospholipid phosphatase